MKEIPEHWRHYYEELEDRGWYNPDTHKPVENPFGIKFDYHEPSKLQIDGDSLERLRVLLLDLGINDNNILIARLYWELARRTGRSSFYDKLKGEKLFNIAAASTSPEELIAILSDVSKGLPIGEDEYIELAKILGTIIIKDNNNSRLDEYSRGKLISSAQTFLYLQRRAKTGNGYELNDDELKNIESVISEIVKNYDSDEKTSSSRK